MGAAPRRWSFGAPRRFPDRLGVTPEERSAMTQALGNRVSARLSRDVSRSLSVTAPQFDAVCFLHTSGDVGSFHTMHSWVQKRYPSGRYAILFIFFDFFGRRVKKKKKKKKS